MSTLEINTALGHQVIILTRVRYIKAFNKKSRIYFTDDTSLISNHLLKWFQEHLPYPQFFRCHKSIIVNCNFIMSYNYSNIVINSKLRLPISRHNLQLLRETLRHLCNDQITEIDSLL